MSETTLVNEPPKDAVVVTTLSKLQKAVESAASSNGEMRAQFAKAEALGMNLKASKKAISLLKIGDDTTKDWVEEVTETVRYLRLCGVELTKEQLELFNFTDTTMAPVDERAYENGLYCGRYGQNQNENPYDLSSEAGQKWMEGWNKGAEERRAVLAMEPTESQNSELVKSEETPAEGDPFDDTLGGVPEGEEE